MHFFSRQIEFNNSMWFTTYSIIFLLTKWGGTVRFLRPFSSICTAPKSIGGGEKMRSVWIDTSKGKLFTLISSHISFSLHSLCVFAIEQTSKAADRCIRKVASMNIFYLVKSKYHTNTTVCSVVLLCKSLWNEVLLRVLTLFCTALQMPSNRSQ